MESRKLLGIVLIVLQAGMLTSVAQGGPESEINLPMRIGIRPLFDWAERSVDTVFTSDGYPAGWVQPQCDLRYRYRFQRGPLRMRANGQTLELGFTGQYQIEGSTRVCIKGVVISPWTPPCRCGFGEGNRKVQIGFLNTLSIQPRYQLRLNIQPQTPQAIDACKVCLWEQDITKQVMQGMEAELSEAKRSMEQQYGRIDLKPYMIRYWSEMNKPISLGNYGWLMIRPLGFRVNRLLAVGDSIDLSVGLKARPVLVNSLPPAYMTAVPEDWEKPAQQNGDGFSIRLSIDLRYDSLSRIVNGALLPMDIKPEKGPFRKNLRIDSIQLNGKSDQRIQCRLFLSGKYAGELVLSGKQTWTPETGMLSIDQVEFDLQTRHKLLGKAAKWFDRPIRQWLEKKLQFDLQALLEERRKDLEEKMNQAEVGPLRCRGKLDLLTWEGSENRNDSLHIEVGLQGKMSCTVDLSRISL